MSKIDIAIEVASKAHRNQTRKGTDIPYITHPFAVGIILAQEGCPEEVIVAGIIHDTIEDTSITLEYIRENFGEKVASIVQGCSEPDKSLPWEERKKHTIEYLRNAPLEVRTVACADKLHNVRTIAEDQAKIGDEVWKRFKRGKEEQKWYYQSLVDSLCGRASDPDRISIFQQFKKEVERLFERE